MTTLNLQSATVTVKTVKSITDFLYTNRETLSNELKLFYVDVRSIMERQLTKKAAFRMPITEILERAYNIETYILASGAASYNVEFVG